MKFKNMLVLIFLFSVFVISCDPEAKSEQSEISENASDLETRAIPVEALIVKSNTVEQSVPLTGILKPLYEVDIVAEVSGKATEIKKNLGDKVLKGDILAIIDDEVALSNYKQAKAQVLSAENNMKIAQLNLKSDKELFENGDISKLAFENSTLTVKTAEANHLLAMANLSLLKKAFEDTRIKSPIGGLVSRKNIDPGTMVTPNMPVYHVVDLNVLKIELGVPQAVIGKIHVGSDAQISLSALNGKTFDGKVRYISPQAEENTGSFTTEVHVQNTSDFLIRAGMTAKVDLSLSSQVPKLTVPDYAQVSKNGKDYIYRISSGDAELIEILTGETFGVHVVVEKGLVEGDTIVVVGMKNLGVKTKVLIETLHENK